MSPTNLEKLRRIATQICNARVELEELQTDLKEDSNADLDEALVEDWAATVNGVESQLDEYIEIHSSSEA